MNQFVDYLIEVFGQFGPITVQRMFGGFGIYRDELMFALVADYVLYLKADDETKEEFEARGLSRFEYDKAGKTVSISYYEAPEEVYENPDDAEIWGQRAFAAALRAKSRSARKRRKRP